MATTNWAGTHVYRAQAIHRPTSRDEIRAIVARAPQVRVLGSRHSFSAIGDAAELVSLDGLAPDVVVDRAARTVACGAGVKYGELATALAAEGLALHNLASLPHISVGGAIATATHGSGDGNGNLATAVSGIELVTSTGDVVTAARGDADFDGLVVGLGALGAVTRVALDVEHAYEVRQRVFEGLGWDALYEHFDEIAAGGYSVSVPGPWSDRLPHFRMGFTPSNGEEIQSEYHVARPHAGAAIRAVQGLAGTLRPVLQVCELRTIAADRLWMSPQYGQATLAMHFTWTREPEAVARVLVDLEAALAPFQARPHWGKAFLADAATLAPRYERLADFAALAERLDPRGAFRNDWLAAHVLGAGS
jgi:alditol oxidase